MSTVKLSDAEVHPLVIESIQSMTREEAQAWLDHVEKVFGPEETSSKSRSRSGSNGLTAPKKPSRCAKSHPVPAG